MAQALANSASVAARMDAAACVATQRGGGARRVTAVLRNPAQNNKALRGAPISKIHAATASKSAFFSGSAWKARSTRCYVKVGADVVGADVSAEEGEESAGGEGEEKPAAEGAGDVAAEGAGDVAAEGAGDVSAEGAGDQRKAAEEASKQKENDLANMTYEQYLEKYGSSAGDVAAEGAGDVAAEGVAAETEQDVGGSLDDEVEANALAALEALAELEGEPADHIKGHEKDLIFTVPKTLVAGCPAKLYLNTNNSDSLRGRPWVKAIGGYNGWRFGSFEQPMADCSKHDGKDNEALRGWFCTDMVAESEAYKMDFVFHDGGDQYENNGQKDFELPVEFGLSEEEYMELLREREADERDTNEARDIVNKERWEKDQRKGRASASLERDGRTIFKTPAPLVAGSKGVVLWNKAHNPIGGDAPDALTLHVGYNGFAGGIEDKIKLVKFPLEDADENNAWYGAEVDLPKSAYVLNFVLSDVDEMAWDNNDGGDFNVSVQWAEGVDEDALWEERVTERVEIMRRLRKEAQVAEAARKKKRAEEKSVQRAEALNVIMKQQAHIIYTEPSVIEAGKPFTLFYNKANTNLDFAEEIHMTYGFNRWKHEGVTEPVEMTPVAAKPGIFSSVVEIPTDAWMADFVFSSGIGEGHEYDNKFGRDYHLIVKGDAKPEPIHICHISVEMAPIAKVGGLGDVVVSLSRAVQEAGHKVEVLLPKYQFFNSSPILNGRMEYETHFEWGGTNIRVEKCIVEDVQVFFIEPQNNMFSVDSVYGRNDDGVRFDFFCNAALEFLLKTGRQPDILHCHDWSTAEVAPAYWNNYHHNGLWKPKVAFTIHNMNYGQAKIGEASFHSQLTTTVSPSYAGEVAGHPAVCNNLHKFHGVRNGIDPDIWDPETDIFLPMKYNADNQEAGKAAAREALRNRLGMSGWEDKPIVGVVSRLTAQKGIHLIKHAAHHALSRGAQFVLLGSAPDPKIQGDFNGLQGQLGGADAGFFFAFDEPLSHLVYAGCDVILVPSMFEPCGLTQMTAMRYGTVPCVRATGGLRDTVFDVDVEKERAAWEVNGSTDWKTDGGDATNGFSFEGTDEGSLDYALDRCIDAYWNDRAWFRGLQERVMRQDWSWNKPALDYIELYYSAITGSGQ